MSGTSQQSNNIYYSVVGGEFKTRSHAEDSRAESRVNKNGVTVWEISHKAIFGLIENVSIFDGKLGKQINITLDPDEDGKTPILTFGVESRNGRSIMEKLPALDFTKEVRFMPYSDFTPPGATEPISGLSLHQKDDDGKYTVKIDSHFYRDGKTREGLPVIDWNNATESEKKIHTINKADFLLKYFTENILTKFNGKTTSPVDYPEDEIRPEDIPF